MASTNALAASSSNPNRQSAIGGDRQSPSASKPVPVLNLPALQNASRVLLDQLNKDAQLVPDLSDLLNAPNSQSYSVFPDDFRTPYQKRKLVGIPEGLFQYYNSTKVTTHMGLMPEIERVWITIDHHLFLWDYIEGQELSSFADQQNVINHVALVKPKPGVFIDEITSLLVVCTPVSVFLLGVSANTVAGPNNRVHKEIKLYSTDMSVPFQVEMTSVIGTQEGRIFMHGVDDGFLYEFHYQEKEGWFGKRVQIINHSVGGVQSLLPRFGSSTQEDKVVSVRSDTARGILYTLTTHNVISIYRGSGDKSIQLVQVLVNLCKLAQDKAPGSPALTPQNFKIIALHPISPRESRSGVQLMALTANAARLYFAPSSYGTAVGRSAGTSNRLQLVHVRLPPTNLLHPDEQSNPSRPTASRYDMSQGAQQSTTGSYTVTALESSCYDEGLTIAARHGDLDGVDHILCLSPDLKKIASLGRPEESSPTQQNNQQTLARYGTTTSPTRPPLTENATVLTIPGRTWAMAPVPRPSASLLSASSPNVPSPVVTNELAYQFSEPRRQFIILTHVGLTYLAKKRAIDSLKDVVEEFLVENNAAPLVEFRNSFGRDQTCAMLLALASGNTFLDMGEQSSLNDISTIRPELAAVAKQAFYDFGERPMWTERVTYGTSNESGTAIFSGRRGGLALYFARLVRPFWKAKLTKPGALDLQELAVDANVLVISQKNLLALKELLDGNPQLFHSTSGDHTGVRPATASDQEAWKAEQNSVSQLISLLTRTIEAISFVLLLNDHRVGEVVKQCGPDTQALVTSMTFEELITDEKGITASRGLVSVVINQQIGQQISVCVMQRLKVDTISEILQQRCGSFCSTDDVLLYKAKENIRKAVETHNLTERQTWLGESLRLFAKGARNLEFEKLREICGDYQQLNYARGAVELPLHCAQAYDADNQGSEYWAAGCPADDSRANSWKQRLHCYELVLDSLSVFEDRAANAKQPATGALTVDDPETVRNHAYELSFDSQDEMFHSTLYDWLIKRGMADELLEMRPSYLEAHLRREPVTVEKFQLLWQFYVKDGQPLRAAEVLAALAESTEFDLSLDERIEYLTLAVGNAKSHPISAGGAYETAIAFLTDLEERLDVAQVQLELVNTLLPRASTDPQMAERVKNLSKGLLTITELYQLYAEPLDLPIVKLLVLHVSQHHDDTIVRPIWNKIFQEAIDGVEPKVAADRIVSKVVSLGQRFYPSESAFPLRHVASLLVQYSLSHKDVIPFGWAPRILVQCGVPYAEVWDILWEMYEMQVPPFNVQQNLQAISSDIAVLLTDWLEEAKRPQSAAAQKEFPVNRIDRAVDHYLSELDQSRTETKAAYENIKRQLRMYW
ncbi:nucleoporin [Laetiporus sulphureus 93-53]|uniref:Nucleoporin n=1 Tax=Laetiporus sulphureus 93-53 TaxID=1314785 RepID=A0A165E0F7_9APHY|nr:nucleoporin [Laetiporus sulphureus 93-53]KZT06007.1 nucleoporin [Laetiporus sulphureus 93-53]